MDMIPLRKQRHIAIFIFGLTGGGATRRTVTLANGMATLGHRVDLVVLRPSGPSRRDLSPLVNLVTLDSFAISLCSRIPSRRRKNMVMVSAGALARYVREKRPEVLMSAANHVHLCAVTARRIARVPVRLVLRVSTHLSGSLQHDARKAPPVRLRWIRYRYGYADQAIAVSEAIAEDLIAHTDLASQDVCVIHNPTFTPGILSKARTLLDHPWFTVDSPPVILAAGRFSVSKDFPTLLRAFARIRNSFKLNWLFWVKESCAESWLTSRKNLGSRVMSTCRGSRKILIRGCPRHPYSCCLLPGRDFLEYLSRPWLAGVRWSVRIA